MLGEVMPGPPSHDCRNVGQCDGRESSVDLAELHPSGAHRPDLDDIRLCQLRSGVRRAVHHRSVSPLVEVVFGRSSPVKMCTVPARAVVARAVQCEHLRRARTMPLLACENVDRARRSIHAELPVPASERERPDHALRCDVSNVLLEVLHRRTGRSVAPDRSKWSTNPPLNVVCSAESTNDVDRRSIALRSNTAHDA